MFVCICKAVRSKDLNEVIASGATTLEAIGQSCGAGTDCGSCVRRIQQLLRPQTPAVATENVDELSSEKKAV